MLSLHIFTIIYITFTPVLEEAAAITQVSSDPESYGSPVSRPTPVLQPKVQSYTRHVITHCMLILLQLITPVRLPTRDPPLIVNTGTIPVAESTVNCSGTFYLAQFDYSTRDLLCQS